MSYFQKSNIQKSVPHTGGVIHVNTIQKDPVRFLDIMAILVNVFYKNTLVTGLEGEEMEQGKVKKAKIGSDGHFENESEKEGKLLCKIIEQ